MCSSVPQWGYPPTASWNMIRTLEGHAKAVSIKRWFTNSLTSIPVSIMRHQRREAEKRPAVEKLKLRLKHISNGASKYDTIATVAAQRNCTEIAPSVRRQPLPTLLIPTRVVDALPQLSVIQILRSSSQTLIFSFSMRLAFPHQQKRR